MFLRGTSNTKDPGRAVPLIELGQRGDELRVVSLDAVAEACGERCGHGDLRGRRRNHSGRRAVMQLAAHGLLHQRRHLLAEAHNAGGNFAEVLVEHLDARGERLILGLHVCERVRDVEEFLATVALGTLMGRESLAEVDAHPWWRPECR